MKNQLFTSLLATITLGTSILSGNASASAFNIKSRNEAPASFTSIIQEFRAFVGEEAKTLNPETIKAKQVDLSKLQLKFDHDVNVFFIGETAGGYRNRLDFKATFGSTVTEGKIFGDTSCNTGQSIDNFLKFCPNANKPLANTVAPNRPLNVGDWANIGKMQAGTQLDFLLYANDINGGISGKDKSGKTVKGIWSLNQALNPDGLQHAIAYYYKDYLVFGFEDLWGGGDKDYNDTVFAIDIGKENARYIAGITPVPEPSATLALFGIAGLGLFKLRRRSAAVVKADSAL
ncbi:DUF4114 domain-containing protein [Calothrix sp. FACHB-1219]|uniref:DUF4114 domain-containing protein n=1 Tax=unclassified Calothrix TaxID=2619626 RepID=UPI0016873F0F|nr:MULTISPECIES: DUF4114 domain-containing protein [unclassified Calothrix]MBD2201868.1 DUF4114 domain-containing protein [Calothrix sp. FACHB-168]MBD2217554.1 DUF4114 domain-containing protein [Calothrix sp. FACHB-1219]